MNPQDCGIDGKGPELCILEDYPDIYLGNYLSTQKHVTGTY